jgi:hypothetical protein
LKPIKLIVIAILVMLIVSTVAYFLITGDMQEAIDDIINPLCETEYNKFEYNWGTVWKSKSDPMDKIVWSIDDNRLIIDWNTESLQTQVRFSTGGVFVIGIFHRIGGVFFKLIEHATLGKYTEPEQHAGYLVEHLSDVKNNLNMSESEWRWSMCMLERIAEKGEDA